MAKLTKVQIQFFVSLAVVLTFGVYFYWFSAASSCAEPNLRGRWNLVTHKDTAIHWQAVANDGKLKENINWMKIEKKVPPPAGETYDKWIVVTSIASPTEQVQKLSKIQGWKLVVVADLKTPKDWT